VRHRILSGVCAMVTLALGFAAMGAPAGGAAAGSGTVRVVSFNIRYGTANDGPNRWEVRSPRVVETIEGLGADVLGLQEALPFQIRELLVALPRYAATGVSREDGKVDGEASPILFDRTRFTLAGAGTFWLSDTPDEAGTNTWGAACNRVCSWARLVDLATGTAFVIFNTHWDHVSQPAREKSAALLLERAASIAGDEPVVVMGDMNAAEDNSAMIALLGVAGRLADTYRAVHPEGRAGTFTGFRTDSDGGAAKIDHVLAGPGWRVLDAGIDRRMIEGRYPSDHFPVWALLAIPE
jgi:endonuclease/exonuclease/phosphatase family metal-dependent hydrolase